VIDGLRPDSIDSQITPHLYRLRGEGVSFLDAHAVFPTGTRVNAAAIATGTYPGSNGLVGNSLYVRGLSGGQALSTQGYDDLLRAQRALQGRLLLTEGLDERLARHGMKLAVVSSASTGSSLLLNPKAPDGIGVLVNGAFEPGVRVAYPDDVNREVLDRFGPAPPKAGHARSRDALVDWSQRVLMEYVVPQLAPDVAIDWISEPDHTQHAYGVGSPEALRALRNVDRNVGYVLASLEGLGLADSTNLFVLSDHGVTRYGRAVDVDRTLIESSLKSMAGADDVVVGANGPCAQLFVPGHDPGRVQAIVSYLQRQEWTGVIFTPANRPPFVNGSIGSTSPRVDGPVPPRGWVEGTFSLELAHLFNPERSCDVLLTFPWGSEANEFGVSGTDVTTAVGRRTLHSGHGSPSPWAIHTTLIAKGPDIKSGTAIHIPVGHADLVPTILSLKKIQAHDGLEGRVLTEALRGGPEEEKTEVQRRTFTTGNAEGSYRAAIQISEVHDRWYLDKAWRLPRERTTVQTAEGRALSSRTRPTMG
jgi:arylsulfatase A-like enzyme